MSSLSLSSPPRNRRISEQLRHLSPANSPDFPIDNCEFGTLSPSLSNSPNSALQLQVKDLTTQLQKRDDDLTVAARIGESLLSKIHELQTRVNELEKQPPDVARSISQLSLIDEDLNTLKGLVTRIPSNPISRQTSLELPALPSYIPVPTRGDKTPKGGDKTPVPKAGDKTPVPKTADKTPKNNTTPKTPRSTTSSLTTPTKSLIKKTPTRPKKLMDKLQQTKELEYMPIDESLIHTARSMQSELESQRTENKLLQKRVQELESSLESLKGRNETLSAKETRLEEQVWNLEVQVETLTTVSHNFESVNEKLRTENEALKAEVRKKMELIEQLKENEFIECERIKGVHETITSVLRREIAALQKENKSLLKMINEEADETTDKSYISLNENTNTSAIELELQSANESLAYAADQLSMYKTTCDQLVDEKHELIRMLAEAQETIEKIGGDLEFRRGVASIRSGISGGWSVKGLNLLKELRGVESDFAGSMRSRSIRSLKSPGVDEYADLGRTGRVVSLGRIDRVERASERTSDVGSMRSPNLRSEASSIRSPNLRSEAGSIQSPNLSPILRMSMASLHMDASFGVSRRGNTRVEEIREDFMDVPGDTNTLSMHEIGQSLHGEARGEVFDLDGREVLNLGNVLDADDPHSNLTEEPLSAVIEEDESHGDKTQGALKIEDLEDKPESPTTATNPDFGSQSSRPEYSRNFSTSEYTSDFTSSDASSMRPTNGFSDGPVHLLNELSMMHGNESGSSVSGVHVRLVGRGREEGVVIPEEPVQALAATMIGGWFHKYNRFNKNPQMRFVWLNPYSRTLFWSPVQPSQQKHGRNVKTAYIESFSAPAPPDSQNTPPTESHHILITSPDRVIKLVPLTWSERLQWTEGLALLLNKTNIPVTEQFKMVATPPPQLSMPHPNDPSVAIMRESTRLPPRVRQHSLANSFSLSFANSSVGSEVGSIGAEVRRKSSRLFRRWSRVIDENEEREIRRSQSFSVLE